MTFSGTILIVEDCVEAVTPLEIALQTYFECPVQHATDAEIALDLLTNPEITYSAVITDLNLPGKSGFDLIEAVRTSPAGRVTPIIVVSACAETQAVERARRLGADAFFAKPCSPVAVCQSLERILHAKQLLPASSRITITPSGPSSL